MRCVMGKEFEIFGCIEADSDMSEDEFIDAFLALIESKGWFFGGGIKEYSKKESLTEDVFSENQGKK